MKPIQGARERVLRRQQQDDVIDAEVDLDYVPPRDNDGKRTDGPTIEEYVAAGYAAASYPPEDYAAVESPGWTIEQERRAAEREESHARDHDQGSDERL